MITVRRQQRKVWPWHKLKLRLVAIITNCEWKLIALNILHQVLVDPHTIFKKQIFDVQASVEGDEITLCAHEAIHLCIKVIYHPDDGAAVHHILVEFQFLPVSKFNCWLYN